MQPSSARASKSLISLVRGEPGMATNSTFPCLVFGRKSMTPHLGGRFSFLFLSATPLSQSCTLEGLFNPPRHPIMALYLGSLVASGTSEIQGCFKVCCDALIAEVPGDRRL